MAVLPSQVNRQMGHCRSQLVLRHEAVRCAAPQLMDRIEERAWNSSEMKAGAMGHPWNSQVVKDSAVQTSAATTRD